MSATEKFWAGEFGDAYLSRNRVDWRTRLSFWKQITALTGAGSAFEVGCNAGWNLLALRDIGWRVSGVDLNLKAVREAHERGLDVSVCPATEVGRLWPQTADLTFTAGVLIHIPPEDLRRVMESIVQASRRWVLAVEYWAPEEQMVPYRGNDDRLWRRPFGELYEQIGLRRVADGHAEGFDMCRYALMEKP